MIVIAKGGIFSSNTVQGLRMRDFAMRLRLVSAGNNVRRAIVFRSKAANYILSTGIVELNGHANKATGSRPGTRVLRVLHLGILL